MALDVTSDIGNAILAAAADALTCSGHTPPTRQFFGLCVPAVDCEMLTVYLSTLDDKYETRGNICIGNATQLVYTVEVHRCVSTNIVPSSHELQSSAVKLNRDAWLLRSGLTVSNVLGTIDDMLRAEYAALSRCETAVISGIECMSQDGGFSGWRMRVAVDTLLPGCDD